MTSRFFNRVMPRKNGGFEVSPTPAINRNSVDTTPTGGTNPSNGYSRGTPQRRSTVAHQPPSVNSPRTGTIRQEMKTAASPNPVKRFQVQGNTGPYPETRTELPGSTDPHQTPVETRYEVPAPHPTASELVSDAIHFAQNSKNTTPKRLPPTPVQTPTQYEELDRIGNYQLIKTIGKGNFAKVKLAKHIPTGQQVAIKMIDKTQLSESDLKKLYREVRIMKRLNHPNIVKLYEILEDDRYLHLVLEYASRGEIFDYVVSRGRLQEADARKKFRQIISAIQYCHRNNIVHRDLKAENLLLDEDMNLKIADFGFSNEFTSGHKLNTFCGSPPYAAPELFQGKKYDGPEVDVWSLGVILYTMVSGSLPFDGRTIKDLKERIVKGRYQIPFYMTAECEQMLRKFLVINPARRTTLENAMQEKWINLGYEGRELKPYEETTSTLDEDCIDSMVEMGYNRDDIRQSLDMLRYDHLYATYHLLVTKSSPVRGTVSRASMGQSLQRTPLRRSIQNGDVIHTAPSQPSAAQNGGPSSAPVPPPRTRRLKPGVDNNTIKNNKPSGASVRRTPSNIERPSNDVIYATPSNNNTNGYVNGKPEPDLKLIQTTYSRATANNQRRMRSPSSDSQNRMSIRQTGNNAAVLNQYRMRSPSSDSQNRVSTRQSVVQTNPRGSQRYDSRPGNTATLPSSNSRQLPTSGAQRGVEYITNPQNSRISAHRRNPSVDNQRPINSSVPKRSTTPSNLVSTSIVTDPRQGRNRDVRTGLSSRAASQTIPSAINTSTNHIFSDFDSASMSRQGSIRSTCSISVTPTKFIRQNPARQTVDGRSTAVSPNIIYLPPDKVGKVEMKSRSRFPFFDRFKFSNKR